VRLRSPDIEGVPLPRDVKDSLNVSTFFRFSGRIFDACLFACECKFIETKEKVL
jgi:hypothetical protein